MVLNRGELQPKGPMPIAYYIYDLRLQDGIEVDLFFKKNVSYRGGGSIILLFFLEGEISPFGCKK